MENKLACYDIDGTLSKGMLATPLVISEYQSGFVNTATCIELAKLVIGHKFGNISYEKALDQLLRIHAFGLRGQSEAEVKNHAEKFVQQHDGIFRKFGGTVINLLRDSYDQIIVTAEPRYMAEVVQEHFKMDGAISTQYEIVNGKFTGEIASSLTDLDSKLKSLENRGIHIAFGNTEGDIEMLRHAEYPFCICPTPGLRLIAIKENWPIYTGSGPLIANDIGKLLLI